jgi:signal peptidase I
VIPDRLLGGLSRPWRRVLDWVLTIAVAIGLVLAFEAEVAKPYRVPSSSMEPTLHCAKPARGCLARFSDRVIAVRIVYRFRDPHRGEIAVFHAPAAAATCGERGSLIFIKRVIGQPGDTVSERNGVVFIDGKRLAEPYVPASERDNRTGSWPKLERGSVFRHGRQQGWVMRFSRLGAGRPRELHRAGIDHVLAA